MKTIIATDRAFAQFLFETMREGSPGGVFSMLDDNGWASINAKIDFVKLSREILQRINAGGL